MTNFFAVIAWTAVGMGIGVGLVLLAEMVLYRWPPDRGLKQHGRN